MYKIQNTDAINAIRNGARLSITEGFPTDLDTKVVPVMDMTPDFHPSILTKIGTTTGTGSGTMLAATPNIKYHIHGYQASYVKDATCDASDGNVQWNLTQRGVVQGLVAFPTLTLTAMSGSESAWFGESPIICDENTAVSAASFSFAAGKCRRTIILYYTEESV